MKIRREQIIDTAMTLLDQEGLEGVTIRRVATDLLVQPGALYWHVRNKQELIDEMANALLSEHFAKIEGPTTGQDWSDWLREICQRLRQAMLAHREGARVVAGAGFRRAVLLAQLVQTMVQSLVDSGLSLRLSSITSTTALSYVYGFVIEEQAAPGTNTTDTANDVHASDTSIIAAFFDEKRINEYTSDVDFLAGLELILNGAKYKAKSQSV